MTPEQRHAAGGFYCQNCSRVLVKKQGDICPSCRKTMEAIVDRTEAEHSSPTFSQEVLRALDAIKLALESHTKAIDDHNAAIQSLCRRIEALERSEYGRASNE